MRCSAGFWKPAGRRGVVRSYVEEARGPVASYLLQRALHRSELESLSAERPVLLDPKESPVLTAALRPARSWYEVAGSRVTKAELREAGDRYRLHLESLARAAGTSANTPAGWSFYERVRLGFGAPNLP